MAKCEYSTYSSSSDRCLLKGQLPGMSDDKVSGQHFRDYCRWQDEYKKCPFYLQAQKQKNSGSGCYLTSACVRAKGLPDDCDELQTLRAFRDGWLKEQPYGEQSIQEYYRIAPAVVERIDARPDAEAIYSAIYTQVILPCIEYIRTQKNEAAYTLYRQAAARLAEQFC